MILVQPATVTSPLHAPFTLCHRHEYVAAITTIDDLNRHFSLLSMSSHGFSVFIALQKFTQCVRVVDAQIDSEDFHRAFLSSSRSNGACGKNWQLQIGHSGTASWAYGCRATCTYNASP